MLTTPTECHVLFNTIVQETNTNVRRVINPNYIDYYLRDALMMWIETRANPKTNYKQEGLSESVKRIDDLKNLETKVSGLDIFKYDERAVYNILPPDYLKYIDSAVHSIKSCSTSSMGTTSQNLTKYIVLPLSYTITLSKDFEILVNGSSTTGISSTIYNSLFPNGFNRIDSKFQPINTIMQYINSKSTTIKIYWERLNDLYFPNSFIISGIGLTTATMQYKNTANSSYVSTPTALANLHSTLDWYNKTASGNCINNCILTSSERVTSYLNDDIYSSNMYKHPYVTLQNNKHIIYHDNKFTIDNCEITYYRKPRLYDITSGIMPEIEKHEEVVNLAALNYLGVIGSPTTNTVANKVRTIE